MTTATLIDSLRNCKGQFFTGEVFTREIFTRAVSTKAVITKGQVESIGPAVSGNTGLIKLS